MDKNRIILSTTAADASETARKWGLGLEIAEFCTAWNMDEEFPQTEGILAQKLEGLRSPVLHAPFNELFPCAIDREARRLAKRRYCQAIELAHRYGAEKVVIHGGFNPWLYYPVWYVEQSIPFWREFLQEDPGVDLVLENVLEETPDWLAEIVEGVGHPRLGICLDIGHVNSYAKTPLDGWLTRCAPHIRHFHIHNNDGSWDTHNPLPDGSIPMADFLRRADTLCPGATFTLELLEAETSVVWLHRQGLMEA